MDILKISAEQIFFFFFAIFVSLTTHLNKDWSPRQQLWKVPQISQSVCERRGEGEKRGEGLSSAWHFFPVRVDWSVDCTVCCTYSLRRCNRIIGFPVFRQGSGSLQTVKLSARNARAGQLDPFHHQKQYSPCETNSISLLGTDWKTLPSLRILVRISDPLPAHRASNSSPRLLLTRPRSYRWLHQPTGSLCFTANFTPRLPPALSTVLVVITKECYYGWLGGKEKLLKARSWALFALRHHHSSRQTHAWGYEAICQTERSMWRVSAFARSFKG